jgi:hypothetical protein
MSYQEYVNILMGVVSFFGGFVLKEIWSSLKGLQDVDKGLTAQLNRIEVIIASEYVRKNDLEKALDTILAKLDKVENLEILISDQYSKKDDVSELVKAIFSKLDRIEEKLDKKADKLRNIE